MEDQKVEIMKLQIEKLDIEKKLNSMADSMEEDRKRIQQEVTEKNKAELEFIAESCLKSKGELSALKSKQKQFIDQIKEYVDKIQGLQMSDEEKDKQIAELLLELKARKSEVLFRDIALGNKDRDIREFCGRIKTMERNIYELETDLKNHKEAVYPREEEIISLNKNNKILRSKLEH